jgi:hypothetical protein
MGPYNVFDIGAVIAAVGMVIGFVVTAIHNTMVLYREETRERQ